MADSILIVEDDQDIAELIKVNMQDLGLEVTHCDNGEDAIKQALENDYSLLMLDLNLPGCSGLDVCRKVREAKQEQAILMLTARTSELDRVLGLELGADDYMAKPFSVRELQARVHALLRRVHLLQNNQAQDPVVDSSVICHGQLMINQRTHEVVLREQSLDLTSTEFDLLSFMAQHPGQVFSRTQLLDKVWGYQHSGYEHTVNSHINRLRNKLVAGQPNSNNKVFPHIIQTVFGVGYKFSPEGVA
ncbi:response regulator transcription factor [Psychromonas sp. 14N.309.X.WAT.B.A12]|uniref:response regulator transcription factor n=1 Tax=Psychromonas sp. 14N.309.X.WAT.B.A12 TaxID=2998322 RepID=UPI0025AFB093|nr:response regulator transcription factor [Psychromonas sp. 14N.309.X.WAT.B.A12]MDN2663811.1 response regulator transcription factor [Psychromonas sp. 14N.309.X.WAT.B.A12]